MARHPDGANSDARSCYRTSTLPGSYHNAIWRTTNARQIMYITAANTALRATMPAAILLARKTCKISNESVLLVLVRRSIDAKSQRDPSVADKAVQRKGAVGLSEDGWCMLIYQSNLPRTGLDWPIPARS